MTRVHKICCPENGYRGDVSVTEVFSYNILTFCRRAWVTASCVVCRRSACMFIVSIYLSVFVRRRYEISHIYVLLQFVAGSSVFIERICDCVVYTNNVTSVQRVTSV